MLIIVHCDRKIWSNAQLDTPMRDHSYMRGAIRLCNTYEIVHLCPLCRFVF